MELGNLDEIKEALDNEHIKYKHFKRADNFLRVKFQVENGKVVRIRKKGDTYELEYRKKRPSYYKKRKPQNNDNDYVLDTVAYNQTLEEAVEKIKKDYILPSGDLGFDTIAMFAFKRKAMGLSPAYLANRWRVQTETIYNFEQDKTRYKVPSKYADDFRKLWDTYLADVDKLKNDSEKGDNLVITLPRIRESKMKPRLDDRGKPYPNSYYEAVCAGAFIQGAKFVVVYET